MSDDGLSERDREQLDDIHKKYHRAAVSLDKRREQLLKEVRVAVGADLAIACLWQHNVPSSKSIVVDFFCDIEWPSANPKSAAYRQAEKELLRWLSLGMEMNTTKETTELLLMISEGRDRTLNRVMIEDQIARKPKLQRWWLALQLLKNHRLYAKWKAAGLLEYMFSSAEMVSGDLRWGSGIGYHRRLGKPPFSRRDAAFANHIRQNEPWLFATTIAPPSDVTALDKEQRILLPFLLHNFSYSKISEIFEMEGDDRERYAKQKDVEHAMEGICRSLRIEPMNRRTLSDYFRLRFIPGQSAKDSEKDLQEGEDSMA